MLLSDLKMVKNIFLKVNWNLNFFVIHPYKRKNMKNNLTGKFIIAYDTICDGMQSALDENKQPILYTDRREAIKEMFDDTLSMLKNRTPKELKEYNKGVTPAMIKKMELIYNSGDADTMEIFLKQNPTCNDNNESVIPAEEFQLGHKTIFIGN